jgi:hypothetical protein
MHETDLRNLTNFNGNLFYIEQIQVEYYRKWYGIVKGVSRRTSSLRLLGFSEKVCDTVWRESKTHTMLDIAHF